MTYAAECWPLQKQQVNKLLDGLDRIRNNYYQVTLGNIHPW